MTTRTGFCASYDSLKNAANACQTLGASQLATSSPSVDDTAVTNDPHATSMMTTGQVQCFSSESDVSSKVA
jgi:hypothetical protein